MEWVETTGRTIEEAKDAALDKLGIDETDAEFEVLEEPRVGLFGRLRSEARVRARVRPNRPRPKEDRRDRQRRNRSTATSRAAAPEAGSAADPDPSPGERSRPRNGEAPKRRATKDSGAKSRAGQMTPEREGAKMEQDVPLLEQAEVAKTFLLGLLDAFDMKGDVEVHELDEDTVELALEGDDLRLLIGHGGTTLAAVQEITRRAVQRQTRARNGRLVVDVAGYRRKRKAALERFVEGIAADVVATGTSKALEPMPAADRKVVHDTVNRLEGVSTTSEGEEPRRRVVISPS